MPRAKGKVLRLRIPVAAYEKVRLTQAIRRGTEYHPLDPPPPSGFMETTIRFLPEAFRVLRFIARKRRKSNPNYTLSDALVEVIEDREVG